MFHNEFFIISWLVNFFQFSDAGIAFVGLFSNEDVDERIVSRFQNDGIFGRVQACWNSVVGIDYSKGNVGQAAGNGSCIQFQELEVMWIFGDIGNGGSNVFDIFDFDQPGIGKN